MIATTVPAYANPGFSAIGARKTALASTEDCANLRVAIALAHLASSAKSKATSSRYDLTK